jgi:hypothetical protein
VDTFIRPFLSLCRIFEASMNRYTGIFFLTLLHVANGLQAQDTINRIDPIGIQVIYEPNLRDARKIEHTPETERRRFDPPVLEYSVLQSQWNARRVVKVPPPSRIRSGADSVGNANYARAGYGLYNFKNAEISLSNRPNDKYAYNVSLNHLSADQTGSSRDFADNSLRLGGSRFYKRSSFTGSFGYNRNMLKYYGKDSGYTEAGIPSRKLMENWQFGAVFETQESGKKPGFKVGLQYENFNTNLFQTESEISLQGGWRAKIQKQLFFGDIAVTNLQYRQKAANNAPDQVFIDINPSYRFTQKNILITAGARSTVLLPGKNKSEFYINPVLNAEYEAIPGAVKVFGGIGGGLQRNSLRRLNAINPFLFDSIEVRQTYEAFSAYIGAKGKISNNSEFVFDVTHRSMNNLPLFINAGDSLNSFIPRYDNLGILTLHPEFRLGVGEKFKLALGGKFHAYGNPETELRAWQLPTAEFTLQGSYMIGSKLRMAALITGMNNRPQRVVGGATNLSVPGFIDANLMSEYFLSDRFRIWLNLSNLATNQYQLWYRYPRYGFTALGGLAVSF